MHKARTIAMVFGAALALGAAGASSAAASGWMVGGTQLKSSAALAPTAAVTEDPQFSAAGITVTCSNIVSHSEGETHETIETEEWIILIHTEWLECSASSECSLKSPTIGSVPLSGVPVTEGSLGFKTTLAPKTGSIFATVKFEGSNCAIAGLTPITGKETVIAPRGQMEATLQEVKANNVEGELKVGSAAATLKGAALLKLASGKPWSFL
jgi:hypothetical protein